MLSLTVGSGIVDAVPVKTDEGGESHRARHVVPGRPGPSVDDLVVGHHRHVLVLEVVAVEHVPAGVGVEPRRDLDGVVRVTGITFLRFVLSLNFYI